MRIIKKRCTKFTHGECKKKFKKVREGCVHSFKSCLAVRQRERDDRDSDTHAD